MSIQRKLLRILIVTSTVPVLVTCCVLVGFEFLGARQALADDLSTLADVTGWNSSAAVVFRDKQSAMRTLEGLRSQQQIAAACLYDERGLLFASYQRAKGAAECAPRTPDLSPAFSRDRLTIAKPVFLDGERIGAVCLYSDLSEIRARLRRYVQVVPVVLIAALAVTLLLSLRVQQAVTKPILNLARVARLVSERRDYSARAAGGGDGEIAILIEAFNGMLAQIAEHAAELKKMNLALMDAKNAAENAAEALSKSEERFRATFDDAPIGMNLVDSNGQLVECNRSLEYMLGYSREELCAKHFADYTHPADAAADLARFEELVKGKLTRYQIEKRLLTKDARIAWARLTVSQLHTHGDEFLAIGMTEDITERKRLEEQFRQAQKMEAIGRLAGGVAHDFNNLLTVIKGNAELSISRLGADSPARRNLDQVRKAADRAAKLVDQLLAFSRKQLIDPKILDLSQIVRDLEKMLRAVIREDIELTVAAGAEPAWVKADPVQMEQILLNLAVNARDAMPDGGRLTIALATRGLATPPAGNPDLLPGNYVVLSVEDTGIGIGEDIRPHIFEPFFTTKEIGKGTGLGLSTVYGIVRQAGGHILVESRPGQGARFVIYLPLADLSSRNHAAEAAPPATIERGNETVLVVEDEELVRTMLCETLAELGYKVLEASNGERALDVARKYHEPIHLLITDMVMPRMSGRELAEAMLRRVPGMKLLCISGYTEEVSGIDAPFLKKPFTPEEIARAVRSVLDGPESKQLLSLHRIHQGADALDQRIAGERLLEDRVSAEHLGASEE